MSLNTAVLSPQIESTGVRLATVFSPALKRRADISLFVPEGHGEEQLPLLVLLHGVYGSHWNWWALGGVVESAQRMIEVGEIQPMAIAMPSDSLWGDGSAYVPHSTFDAERWIAEDVPDAVSALLPHVESSKYFLAGLSMGGYGAIRIGLKHAHRIAGISAHSAVTCVGDLEPFVRDPGMAYLYSGVENVNILHWAERNRSTLPPLRFDCGREDSLLASNRALHAALLALEIPHVYEEHEGGHTWEYWKMHVRSTLRFVSGLAAQMSR